MNSKEKEEESKAHRFAIAPMLDWTDRHCRYFHRLLTRKALLYTEMVTSGAILHGDRARHLGFDPTEHPIALQLGGSDPAELARCARIGQDWGYDQINLNLGCPSDRVQSGRFGACLMLEPGMVADCIKAMRDACDREVTVKHRIGVDQRDSYAELVDFIGQLAEAGCQTFIIHARKAWLKGLSPKENREVPPLRYDWVYRLKQDFPDLNLIINGGIQDLNACLEHLQRCEGVMLGRAAYQNPWLLARVDSRLFGSTDPVQRPEQALQALLPYLQGHIERGGRFNNVARHVLGLFNGQPGARRWRRLLSEQGCKADAGADLLLKALTEVRPEGRDGLAGGDEWA
ncbi:MAG: tRNA dihydrouridine(20/20a) synthase DusA [Gammaproteobacteria bacterium SHHR-1]|uniref:tRNA dihydrouridine(20/20a) synthase DusA n=1 Tax=Magnetovirga frankeli TaxID=947516 RepID=UPI0012935FD0|nr:tRNA dihydrouridine(20/20a) synthase DusA [gamma proteobacterium SS-5]